MYSVSLIQSLQQSFTPSNITLDVKSDYIIAENSQNETEDKIRECIKQAGFCPLLSENKINENFVFTVVPYKTPAIFKFAIHPVATSYKESNEELKNIASKNPRGYQAHFENNKVNILSHVSGMQGIALVLGCGNGDDIPLENMAMQFDEIDVVDMDLSAMQKAIGKLPPALQNKIRPIKQDLTGLISYISKRLAAFDFNLPEVQCLDYASQILADSIKHAGPIPLPKKYNFVVSSMLTSQLSANIQGYVLEVLEKKYPKIQEKMDLCPSFHDSTIKIMNFTCQQHMHHLAKWTLPQGRVYYADTAQLEYVELKRVSTPGGPIINTESKTFDVLPNEDIQQKIQELFNQHGLTATWKWETQTPSYISYTQGFKPGNIMHVAALCLQPKGS